MTEIRKYVGLSFEEFTALWRAVEDIRERLTALHHGGAIHYMEAELPNGKKCFVLVNNKPTVVKLWNNWELPILQSDLVKITKHQSKGDEFTVQLVIKDYEPIESMCATKLDSLGVSPYEEHHKNGTLFIGPAIWSRLDHALGRVTEAEPLYFTVKE